jgi:hypothetical protein
MFSLSCSWSTISLKSPSKFRYQHRAFLSPLKSVCTSSEKVATVPIWLLLENVLLIVGCQEGDCFMNYKIIKLLGVIGWWLWVAGWPRSHLKINSTKSATTNGRTVGSKCCRLDYPIAALIFYKKIVLAYSFTK